MKTLLPALAALLLVAFPAIGASAPATEAKGKAEERKDQPKVEPVVAVVIPQSVFDPSTAFKDPFHPQSKRRKPDAPANDQQPPPPDSQLAKSLVLNGLAGPANRRLAMINGKTLAVGEESEIVTEKGKIKVRCLEIRDSSVILAVGAEGTREELHRKD